jgi:hypothetical protein
LPKENEWPLDGAVLLGRVHELERAEPTAIQGVA